MNNKTEHKYMIKLRGDKVYDVYIDDVWCCSRGSVDSVIADLETIMNNINN